MELKNLPSLSFAERDPATIETNILTTVEALLGRTLARADPLRLFLMGVEAIIVQQRELIDQAAKMNLLAYATGAYLDNIGVLVGTDRLLASAATTTLKFTLSAARTAATTIPEGTRATAGDGVLFALNENTIIPAGETTITARATCTTTGAAGNGYAPGEIKTIVDPVPFVAAVVNTTATEGGADTESDDDYRERIHEAPEKLSTAGPAAAYEYYAKTASALIIAAPAFRASPGVVRVRPLLKGGELPGTEILDAVSAVLNDKTIRPLTDKVLVEAPEKVSYNVNLKYWIDRDDATGAVAIEKAVTNAVNEFVTWEKSKLGRDINQTELYYRIRAAGAKRAVITEPVDTVVGEEQVAIADSITVTLGGLEDD